MLNLQHKQCLRASGEFVICAGRMGGLTLTPGSAAAEDSSEAPRSPTGHRLHRPGNRRDSPLGGRERPTFRTLTCTRCDSDRKRRLLTAVREEGVEGEMVDAPLSADRGPRRLARVVVLHHQGEKVPGKVWTDVLLTHHHTHAVVHTGATKPQTVNILCTFPHITNTEEFMNRKSPAHHSGTIQFALVLLRTNCSHS